MSTQSITLKSNSSPQRSAVFDLFRLLSVLVIVPFHLSEFSFNSEIHPVFAGSVLNTWLIGLAKFIPFSGHSIVMLSFFLLGWGQPSFKKLLRLVAVMVGGYLILLLSYYEAPYQFLYWDIYSFLTLTLVFVFASRLVPYGGVVALVLGILSSTPTVVNWNIEFLGGICSPDKNTSWPLFPWVFYAAAFASLGRGLQQRKAILLFRLQDFCRTYAKWIGIAFAALAFFMLKGMTQVPATDGMYCFIQELSLSQKLFLLLMWGFVFLYGSDPVVISRWRKPWSKYFAKLSWNRNLALAYLIQISLVGLFTSYPDIFMANSLSYDLCLVSIFLGTEFLVQIFVRLRRSLYPSGF